ncbi:MAG: hypothetical protein PHH40_02955 [Candidatus Moranbacteria bacterium]|nr:hypothetical protein [Candidatus Moranbacteria bacterium]MDD3965154.1 hypothetical protein [Candidatus Moranbacteria bacterium]
MLNKKQQEKVQGVPDLKKIITEIPVTKGRGTEPFVKVFNYSDQNIAKSSLGSLVGVFEISDKDENSVFIVNFLTSVAKKEYFSNLRRGSIESFEASLHKINLALAELVKDGHIAWLGKFHGAIGVLEKNNLHFSVTGQAQILLLRNGNLSEISDGITSPESNTHPLKTFIEISSGRLVPQDKIILTSPELFELLSTEELEKNALRMDNEQFSQFLRTVLVNKLDMGGSLIVDFEETEQIQEVKKEVKKVIKTSQNFFSQEPFETAQKEKNAIIVNGVLNNHEVSDAEKEYTDPRTRHIYVHGDTEQIDESHPFQENMQSFLQDIAHSLEGILIAQKKLLRKFGKRITLSFVFLTERTLTAFSTFFSLIHKQWIKGSAVLVSKIRSVQIISPIKKKIQKTSPIHIEYKQSFPSDIKIVPTQKISPENEEPSSDLPPFIKEKLVAFYKKKELSHPEHLFWERFITLFSPLFSFFISSFTKVSRALFKFFVFIIAFAKPKIQRLFALSFLFLRTKLNQYEKKQIILASGIVVTLILGSVFLVKFFNKQEASPVVEVPIENALPFSSSLETEKNIHLVQDMQSIMTTEDTIITSVLLDDEIYLITPTAVLSVNEKKSFLLPEKSGSVTLATPMNDLRLIFISTDTNELFSFAPSNGKFTKNTLNLLDGTIIQSIGTYLTYLYVLDANTNHIYRFPRAEGGFGTGSLWTKSPLALGNSPQIAVSETIFVAPDTTHISAFFRGISTKDFESPLAPLSLSSLLASPDLENIYAIDTNEKRILIWNQEGMLIAQYFSEQFSTLKSISVDEKKNTVFITTEKELLSFTLDSKK